jgi:hypothetical protein
MMNISGSGMRIVVDRPLPVNAAVRVDLENSMFLAEVCYCNRDGATHTIGLTVDQVLHDTPDLLSLWRALDGGVEQRQPQPDPATL